MRRDIPQLEVRPLTLDRIARSYALLQVVASDISLVAWRNFAQRRIDRTPSPLAGIHTVQDRKGNILGLISYTSDETSDDFRILTVDHLVVAAIVEQQKNSVLSALVNAMVHGVARQRRGAMRIRLGSSGSASLDQHAYWLLSVAGHGQKQSNVQNILH